MMAGLTAARRACNIGSSLILPCRSMAGSNAGIMAFMRLEHTRSETSQSAPRASRTAGPSNAGVAPRARRWRLGQ